MDLSAPAYNDKTAKVRFSAKLFSLSAIVEPYHSPHDFKVILQNNFEPFQFVPKFEVPYVQRSRMIKIKGDTQKIPFTWTDKDNKHYSKLKFTVKTSKEFYDQMTDYPYRVFCPSGELLDSGGFQMNSDIELNKFCLGEHSLEIQGAFTKAPLGKWAIGLTEQRFLKDPMTVFEGERTLLETGQARTFRVNLSKIARPKTGDMKNCVVLSLASLSGRKIQDLSFCP